jgi:hypothetical protein
LLAVYHAREIDQLSQYTTHFGADTSLRKPFDLQHRPDFYGAELHRLSAAPRAQAHPDFLCQTPHDTEKGSREAALFGIPCVWPRSYNTCLKAVGEMYWNMGVPGGNRSICRNVESKAQLRTGAP